MAGNTQIALNAVGTNLTGLAALKQSIRVAIATQLGSVPLNPELGVDWLSIVDMPLDDARPILVRDVTRAFQRWIAPRATLVRIEVGIGDYTDGSGLYTRVHYQPAGADVDTLEVGQ